MEMSTTHWCDAALDGIGDSCQRFAGAHVCHVLQRPPHLAVPGQATAQDEDEEYKQHCRRSDPSPVDDRSEIVCALARLVEHGSFVA